MNRVKGFLIAAMALSLPLSLFASGDAGFVRNPLWFSKASFSDGESVKVYSAVQNASDKDLKGTLSFYTDGKEIGSSGFSILAGNSEVIWAKFTAVEGAHSFSAKITKARLENNDGSTQNLPDSTIGPIEAMVAPRPKDAPKKDYVSEATDWLLDQANVASSGDKKAVEPSAATNLVSGIQTNNDIVQKISSATKAALQKADALLGSAQEKLAKKSLEYKNKKNGTAGAPFDNMAALFFATGAAFLGWKTAVYLIAIYIAWRILKLAARKLRSRSPEPDFEE